MNLKFYNEMISSGVSPKLAEMLASRTPPGANTDREFLHGHCNGNQFEGFQKMGDYYQSYAKRAGISTKGKIYLSSLANFPGDPKAWVSDRSEAAKVIDSNGWGAEGAISRKVKKVAERFNKDVADDIVIENAEKRMGTQVLSKKEKIDLIHKTRSSLKKVVKDGR